MTGRSRAELAAEVAQLRRDGLPYRAIGARLVISRSYAEALTNDPDGAKQRKRRASYQGVCERCCGATKSAGTSKPSRICSACSRELQHENARWTRETIVAAIQQFAAEHGRPPLSTEWNATTARTGRADCYPAAGTVQLLFGGSWADAIEAAGFARPTVGRKVPQERVFACDGCGATTRRVTAHLALALCDDCMAERRRTLRRAAYLRRRLRVAA